MIVRDDLNFIGELGTLSREHHDPKVRMELKRLSDQVFDGIIEFNSVRSTDTLRDLIASWTKAHVYMTRLELGGPTDPVSGTPDASGYLVDEGELIQVAA